MITQLCKARTESILCGSSKVSLCDHKSIEQRSTLEVRRTAQKTCTQIESTLNNFQVIYNLAHFCTLCVPSAADLPGLTVISKDRVLGSQTLAANHKSIMTHTPKALRYIIISWDLAKRLTHVGRGPPVQLLNDIGCFFRKSVNQSLTPQRNWARTICVNSNCCTCPSWTQQAWHHPGQWLFLQVDLTQTIGALFNDWNFFCVSLSLPSSRGALNITQRVRAVSV